MLVTHAENINNAIEKFDCHNGFFITRYNNISETLNLIMQHCYKVNIKNRVVPLLKSFRKICKILQIDNAYKDCQDRLKDLIGSTYQLDQCDLAKFDLVDQ